MSVSVQIIFKNMFPSAAAEKRVHREIEKLNRICPKLLDARVVIESQHHHHHKGNLYDAKIVLNVPDAELVASRSPSMHHAHEDLFVAIRDSFVAIKHQLQKYLSQRRGEVKQHRQTPLAKVIEICPMAGYGFIETPEGRRLRFTTNSLVNYDVQDLDMGDWVRFIEVDKSMEPSVSTVYFERHAS